MTDDGEIPSGGATNNQAEAALADAGGPPVESIDNPYATPQLPLYPLSFDGKGGEYFRIWIVNIALSVITIGIYSAWATVRTRRYFYGKTSLDGTPFQFTAKPIPILIGRIIALVLFLIYTFLLQYNIVWGLIYLVAVILPLAPWMIMKSMQFRARYTVWRNIPFGFTGGYWQAVVAYFLMPIFMVLTLGILVPEVWKASARYQFGNIRYGKLASSFPKGAKGFWGTYGLLILFGIATYIAFALIAVGAVFALKGMGVDLDSQQMNNNPAFALIFLPLYIPFFLVGFWVQGRLFNASLSNTRFGGSEQPILLHPTLPCWRYAWVLLSNLFLTIITLGFFWPWAKVRETRVRSTISLWQALRR
jgi:uncharacterized membrane protein YjgN (DUF898 family)